MARRPAASLTKALVLTADRRRDLRLGAYAPPFTAGGRCTPRPAGDAGPIPSTLGFARPPSHQGEGAHDAPQREDFLAVARLERLDADLLLGRDAELQQQR